MDFDIPSAPYILPFVTPPIATHQAAPLNEG